MAEIRPIRFECKHGDVYFIRPAHGKDALKVLECAKQVIGERIYSITTPEEFLIGPEQEIEFLENYRKAATRLFLVVESEKKEIVGTLDFATSRFLRQRHLGEFGMGVLKKVRGRGIGRKLLETFLEWAEQTASLEKICLAVHADNVRARALYEALGFEVEGVKKRETRFESGHYADAILMAKFLKPNAEKPKAATDENRRERT